MSTNDAAADLGMQPAATAAASEPAPAIGSYAEAVDAKNRIISDPEARNKLLAGDTALNQQWRAIQEKLAQGIPPTPTPPNDVEGMISHLRNYADIDESVAAQIREGRPVSAYERSLAEQHKQKLFRDKAWVARYLDGSRHEATELALLNVVLAAPIKN